MDLRWRDSVSYSLLHSFLIIPKLPSAFFATTGHGAHFCTGIPVFCDLFPSKNSSNFTFAHSIMITFPSMCLTFHRSVPNFICNLTHGLSTLWGLSAVFQRFYYSEQRVNTMRKPVASPPPISSRTSRVARTLDRLLGDNLSLLSSSRLCNQPCSEEGCTKETSTTAQRRLERTPEARWGTASPQQKPSPLSVLSHLYLLLTHCIHQTLANKQLQQKGEQTQEQPPRNSQCPQKPWKTGIWFVTSYSWSTKAKSKQQVTQEATYQQFHSLSSPKSFEQGSPPPICFITSICSDILSYRHVSLREILKQAHSFLKGKKNL